MARQYKRRNYFINKREQGRFIMKFVAGSLSVTLVSIGFFNYLANKKLGEVLFAMRLPQDHGKILEGEMLLANSIAFVLIILAFLVTARKIFSGVNGPVRKLNSDLAKIGAGDLRGIVKLRDKDEFQDFAGELDEMRCSLRDKFTRISALTHDLTKLVGEEQGEDLRAKFTQVEKTTDELDQEFRNFKI